MPKKDGSPNAREIDALVKFDQAVQMQNVRLADRQHREHESSRQTTENRCCGDCQETSDLTQYPRYPE
jgi:hypothetical protein